MLRTAVRMLSTAYSQPELPRIPLVMRPRPTELLASIRLRILVFVKEKIHQRLVNNSPESDAGKIMVILGVAEVAMLTHDEFLERFGPEKYKEALAFMGMHETRVSTRPQVDALLQ